jgi:hypothetical protein
VPTVPPVSSYLSRPSLTSETPTPSTIDLGNIISLDSSHVMLRTSRSNAGNPLSCYGFPQSIDQYVDYFNLSAKYGTFIVSLDNVAIPKCW